MRYTVVSTTMFLGLVVLNGIFGLPVNNEGNELTQEVQPGSELSVNQDRLKFQRLNTEMIGHLPLRAGLSIVLITTQGSTSLP